MADDVETVVVTGSAGLLGSWLLRTSPTGQQVIGLTRSDVELSDREQLLAVVRRVRPGTIIHSAYGTADLERDVVRASANVVDACLDVGADLVQLSTDVVFDGEHGPYVEGAPLSPAHAYGRAKARVEADIAERLPGAAIVRTSLVCCDEPLDPRSVFVVDGLRAGGPVTLFTDELRSPVRVDDLALGIWAIVARPPDQRAGPWHLVGSEDFSRAELGTLLAEWAGLDRAGITTAQSAEWTGPEPRPRDCRLTTARATEAGITLRSVRTLFPSPRDQAK